MFFGSIALAIALLASRTLAEEFSPNDAPSGKRAPMGFQGTRGKKDVASSENEEFAKRAPMGFQGMRGKKDPRPDIERDDNFVSEEELEKRAPMGFQGMRGKKDLVTPDFSDSYFHEYEYSKRAPMGFQGTRGKKATLDDDYYKRAAMGFQGMRGKKSLDTLLNEIASGRYAEGDGGRAARYAAKRYPDDYAKRAPMMGFQGMRGKRDEFEDEWEKRAPMGFQGMRGKKSLLEEIEDVRKRAAMGFQGTRGKKNVGRSFNDEYGPESFGGSRDKRDAFRANGAARPKMSPYDFRAQTLAVDGSDRLFARGESRDGTNVGGGTRLQFDERSPYGYFGTRGKKVPRWEIRGKFVGVRGKKWSPTTSREDGSPPLDDNVERMPDATGSAIHFLDIQ